MITAQVWDERRCWVGEGPTASGTGNNSIKWVDILNSKVHSKNLATGNVDEYQVSEHVSFAIPRIPGGEILGTNSGPILRDTNGTIHQLPNRFSADGKLETIPTRWNDAKVSPLGDLWLGTLTYDNLPNQAALYRLVADGSVLDRILDGVTCSNGTDWSDDGRTMYYVDTMTHSVEAFTVDGREISNRRTMATIPSEDGIPDGICMDGEGGLWVAFWGSQEVRRYDEKFTISEILRTSVPFVTSCTFAGPDLKSLIITSAHNGNELGTDEAGMTFICTLGVRGRTTTLYPS